MSQSSENRMKLPPEEMASQDRCFRLSGAYEPFPIDDVDATVPPANIAHSQRQCAGQTQLAQFITGVENVSEDETEKALSQEQ